MKKVTFYLVRHGETLFNTQGRMQGWCDSPLTEKGIEDAHTAKRILEYTPFDRAYTSTSERCRDTAKIVLQGRNMTLHETKGLKEVNFGTFEAANREENKAEFRRRGKAFKWDDVGGDNLESFEKRICETYDTIISECEDGDTVLIVSHGGAYIWMTQILFSMSKEKLVKLRIDKGLDPMPNGYIGMCIYEDGKFRLEEMVDLTSEELDKCRV